MAAVRYRSCDRSRSFFKVIDKYWHAKDTSPASSFHHICTLMRKMEATTLAVEHLAIGEGSTGHRLALEMAAIQTRLGTPPTCVGAVRLTFLRRLLKEPPRIEALSDDELVALPDDQLPDLPPGWLRESGSDDYLGYAVIVNLAFPSIDRDMTRLSYVFECILREPGRFCHRNGESKGQWLALLNNYMHVKREFECEIGASSYTVPGTFFCQQNAITSCCVTACATMIVNNLGEGRCPARDLFSCEQFNQKIEVNHTGRMLRTPHAANPEKALDGLNIGDLQAGLEALGYRIDVRFCGEERASVPTSSAPARSSRPAGLLRSVLGYFAKQPAAPDGNRAATWPQQTYPYWQALYGHIESGFPAVLFVTTSPLTQGASPKQHVVCVVGHTLNSDSWFPLAHVGYTKTDRTHLTYRSTIEWVADVLIHDDNLGMCYCLPAHCFQADALHTVSAAQVPSSNRPLLRESLVFKPTIVVGVIPPNVPTPKSLSMEIEFLAYRRLQYAISQGKGELSEALSGHYYMRHLITENADHALVLRTLLVSAGDYRKHLTDMEDNFRVRLGSDDVKGIMAHLGGHGFVWLTEVTGPDLYAGNQRKLADILIRSDYDAAQYETGPRDGVLCMRLPGLLLSPDGRAGGEPYAISRRLEVCGHVPLFDKHGRRHDCTSW